MGKFAGLKYSILVIMIEALHTVKGRIPMLLLLVLSFFSVGYIRENGVVWESSRLASVSFKLAGAGGTASGTFRAPQSDYLLKLRLDPAAHAPRAVELNGRVLAPQYPISKISGKMRLYYYSVPEQAVAEGGNRVVAQGVSMPSVQAQLLNHKKILFGSSILVFSKGAEERLCGKARGGGFYALLVCVSLLSAYRLWHGSRLFLLFCPFILFAVNLILGGNGLRVMMREELFFLLFSAPTIAVIVSSLRLLPAAAGGQISLRGGRQLVTAAEATEKLLTPGAIFAIVAMTLCVYYLVNFWLLHKVPLGHDTLQYQFMQYTFLNEVVTKGELPLWLPFMTKGTVSNWWFLLQSSLLSGIYYAAAPVLGHINQLGLFSASMLVDELVFALGILLLSLQLYKSRWAVIFATTAAVFSSIWAFQLWYNFHFCYLLPFLFYTLLCFVRTGRYRYLLLSLGILPLSFFGNLPYLFPVFSLAVFLFASGAAVVYRRELSVWVGAARQRSFSMLLKVGLATVGFCGAMLLIYMFLKYLGADYISIANFGRDIGGKVSLQSFLSYGGDIDWSKFMGLLTGFSMNHDQTLYAGSLVPAFVLLQVYYSISGEKVPPLSWVLLWVIICFVSFSTAGIFAVAAYHAWPTMNLYRHIGLVGALLRLFFLLYAAYGLDGLATRLSRQEGESALKPLLALLELTLLFRLLIFVQGYERMYMGNLLHGSMAGLSWALLAGTVVLLLSLRLLPMKRAGVLALICAFCFADVLAYRVSQDGAILRPASAAHLASFVPYDYPFAASRSQDYHGNSRFEAFYALSEKYRPSLDIARPNPYSFTQKERGALAYDNPVWPFGAMYWNSESFFYHDACHSIFRSDHMLSGAAEFFSLFGVKHDDRNVEYPAPISVGYKKTVACGYPKLRLFKNIFKVGDTNQLRRLLSSPSYKGDAVFFRGDGPAAGPEEVYAGQSLGADYEVKGKINPGRFSANALSLSVVNPSARPAVLFYSDAWHEGWKAVVNGRETVVYPANLGFKAVAVPPGRSEVQFSFRPVWTKAAVIGLLLFSGVMLVGLLLVGVADLRKAGRGDLGD